MGLQSGFLSQASVSGRPFAGGGCGRAPGPTYLGILSVVGEVVQAVGAVGREVLHLQSRGVPVLVLRVRSCAREAGPGGRTRVCLRACAVCVSACVHGCKAGDRTGSWHEPDLVCIINQESTHGVTCSFMRPW